MGRVYTNALCVSGLTNPGNNLYDNTESWNGSSWTELNDTNVAKRGCGGQTGTNSSALLFGGFYPSNYVRTNEEWNGTNWTELADMSASGGFGVGGVAEDSTSGLAFGGALPSITAATEEWSSSSTSIKTVDQD